MGFYEEGFKGLLLLVLGFEDLDGSLDKFDLGPKGKG